MTHQYTHHQPTETQLPKVKVKQFDWGLYGIDWRNGTPAQTTVLVSLKINDANNLEEFIIPTPASWEKDSINAELLKLPEFTGSKLIS